MTGISQQPRLPHPFDRTFHPPSWVPRVSAILIAVFITFYVRRRWALGCAGGSDSGPNSGLAGSIQLCRFLVIGPAEFLGEHIHECFV